MIFMLTAISSLAEERCLSFRTYSFSFSYLERLSCRTLEVSLLYEYCRASLRLSLQVGLMSMTIDAVN